MVSVEDLKEKGTITRTDIAELLASLGESGENREAKIEAVKSLGIKNFQGIGLETTVEDYQEY